METGVLLNISLALHLIGLSMSIGVAFTKYLFFNNNFAFSELDHPKWKLTIAAARRLTRFLGIGMGLAILSGVAMMHLAYSAFMVQLWFQLKIALLLVIILLGVLSMRNESKVKQLLKVESNVDQRAFKKFATRIKLLASLQLGFFIVIIIFASFRFS